MVQLVERLGALPGDRVAILAPATHDPAPAYTKRLPRIEWIQLSGGPFGQSGETTDPIQHIHADPLHPPFEPESLDGLVVVLAVPLLDGDDQQEFTDNWAQVLAPFGKWLALLALDGSKDPRLKKAEDALKNNEFTRVRTNRLPGSGPEATYAIMSARKE
jgi:hypothetical protein